MERIVTYRFGGQMIDIYVDNIPENATYDEILKMAEEIFYSHVAISVWRTSI